MAATNAFGAFFKRKRLELGLTLRAFCRENGFDVGNTSKTERGLLSPPKTTAALRSYAEALRLKEESEDWRAFFELAEISAGRIPERIMNDAALVAKLPLVFRTIEGKRLTAEQLQQLAEVIRDA